MDHYRSELEAARQRIAALEDQLQRREEVSAQGVSGDALVLHEEAAFHALARKPDASGPLVMFKDEITLAAERVQAHDLHRLARCGLLASVIVGLVGMLGPLGGSLGAGLAVLGLISLPLGAFVARGHRRLPRTHLCPLCRKPGLYTDQHRAMASDVHRVLYADDASCDDLSLVPWFSELRRLYRRAERGKDAKRWEMHRQMLAMSERMSVCTHHCYDCHAKTKPVWSYLRPVSLESDTGVN